MRVGVLETQIVDPLETLQSASSNTGISPGGVPFPLSIVVI